MPDLMGVRDSRPAAFSLALALVLVNSAECRVSGTLCRPRTQIASWWLYNYTEISLKHGFAPGAYCFLS